MATPAIAVGPPLLRVVTPQALTDFERERDAQRVADSKAPSEDATMTNLAGYVRTQWEMMRNHRNGASGWSDRLLHAQRVFNGKYDDVQLAEITKFGGSTIYAKLIALKCRGATALLREVYLGPDRPWGLDPTPDPVLPDTIVDTVGQLVGMEVQQAQVQGQPLDLNMIRDRTNSLMGNAKRAAKKKAMAEAKVAENKLDDILIEGGFYQALTEFLTDVPLFPFACLKGPIVRIVSDIVWENGKAVTKRKPKMFWERKSPFDIYWTPGVSRLTDGSVIERIKLTRADLNDLLGLPGYDEEAIRTVLDEHGRGGLVDWMDGSDSQRAVGESRENPHMNNSGLIDCAEFHGNVQGRYLREAGMDEETIPDEMRDYFVQLWLIGRHVIKVQVSPNPRKRHPYYITSFEKVPGTPIGNALPDVLSDMQDAANATLRALVNNLSMASGPQVVVDDARLSQGENGDELYPWKRWHTTSEAVMGAQSNNIPPIAFFNVPSNAHELLGVYQSFVSIADELSAIPKYITGSDKLGGAGRTASGLAMLMGNASKVLQMVASNIDKDVIQDILQSLYDMVMLTDTTGTFRGDESIRVRGVDVAVQRETNRQRQIEFLTATANPIDVQIMGVPGRAKVLRAVSETVGLKDDIVPPEEDIAAMVAGAAAPPGVAPPPGGSGEPMGAPPGAGVGGSPTGPQNMDLGVPEANSMRGMA